MDTGIGPAGGLDADGFAREPRYRFLAHLLQGKRMRLPLTAAARAAGIFDDQKKLVAGLSISAPADRLSEDWLPKLKNTADEISEALGYRQP